MESSKESKGCLHPTAIIVAALIGLAGSLGGAWIGRVSGIKAADSDAVKLAENLESCREDNSHLQETGDSAAGEVAALREENSRLKRELAESERRSKQFKNRNSDSEAPPPEQDNPCPTQVDQFIKEVRVTLLGASYKGDTLEVKIGLSNEGAGVSEIALFGGGPVFGNGPSRVMVSGEEFLSTGISFGSERNEWVVTKEVPSGTSLNSTIQFKNIPAGLEDIDVFELNYNTVGGSRKEDTVRFRRICLE